MKNNVLFLAFAIALVAGCSSGEQEASEAPAKHDLFESQRSALEKAKGVQDAVDESAEKQREAVERVAR